MLRTRNELADLLADARTRSLSLTSDLSDEQLHVPMIEIVNPLLWEMGHVAYFAEFWTLRHLHGEPPIVANADALYDSARIPHDERWSLPLPSRAETLDFMSRELLGVQRHLSLPDGISSEAEYFYRLALYHEYMHAEALIYTRQTLGYATPKTYREISDGAQSNGEVDGGSLDGDVRVKSGSYSIGALPTDGFVFDNEKWVHDVELQDFSIARAPVTNAQFAAFISDGGYRSKKFWSDEGWSWLQSAKAQHPLYWRATERPGAWQRRHFDSWIAVRPNEPVCHVNWFEANAFCAWAGRRLPTEAEWEVAATGGERRRYPWGDEPLTPERANVDLTHSRPVDVGALPGGDSPIGCRQMLGNVWEWTATTFEAYPGFAADPYKEYSAPWFGSHKVLRGGAWSTRAHLITTRWRNFYRPHRRDIITGFRTCPR